MFYVELVVNSDVINPMGGGGGVGWGGGESGEGAAERSNWFQ